MAVMDEFRKERATIKNASFEKKWEYFWEYYKWHTIIIVFTTFVVGSMIYSFVTKKDYAFNAMFVNTYVTREPLSAKEDFINEFAEYAGIDTEEYKVAINTDLFISDELLNEYSANSAQTILTAVATGDTEIIAANEQSFEQYSSNDYMLDLRKVFTEEELEKYSDYLYYVDMVEVRKELEAYEQNPTEPYVRKDYDHLAPEEMAEPVPVGLLIQDLSKLKGLMYFQDGLTPLGIVQTSHRVEAARQFIEFLFEDELK